MKKLYLKIFTFAIVSASFCFAQTTTNKVGVGINTDKPEDTLDINGTLRVRDVPVSDTSADTQFTAIGLDKDNKIVRKNADVSSYSVYLGFSPMASSHKADIPIEIPKGYITKLTGTSVGACYGRMTDFTIQFIDGKYVGAELQSRATYSSDSDTFTPVRLDKSKSVFDTELETITTASKYCSGTTGHTLRYKDGKLSVEFLDRTGYIENAGLFVIYSVDKVKITK